VGAVVAGTVHLSRQLTAVVAHCSAAWDQLLKMSSGSAGSMRWAPLLRALFTSVDN